jgi:dTDP-4-dehydrorhamnose reductase
MSSAYVYDGLSPPFHEKHEAKPVNFYGRSKYFAELAITETCSEYLILRVPLLFGTKSLESVSLLIDSITNSESCFVDDYQVRYPTSTDDVAKAIEIAFMKWRGGNPIKGVYNFGSHSGVTKYQMCQILAKRLARSIDHIVPTKVLAPNRPQNCLLVTKKISDSGINFPLLTFSKWIEGLDLEK